MTVLKLEYENDYTGFGFSSSTSPPCSNTSLYSPMIHVAPRVSDSCDMSNLRAVNSLEAVYGCNSGVWATKRMNAESISSRTKLPACDKIKKIV
jgi:hypothetical protein